MLTVAKESKTKETKQKVVKSYQKLEKKMELLEETRKKLFYGQATIDEAVEKLQEGIELLADISDIYQKLALDLAVKKQKGKEIYTLEELKELERKEEALTELKTNIELFKNLLEKLESVIVYQIPRIIDAESFKVRTKRYILQLKLIKGVFRITSIESIERA